MLEWMIWLAAFCGAAGAFSLISVAIQAACGRRGDKEAPQLPAARIHRWRQLAAPVRKALPSGR